MPNLHRGEIEAEIGGVRRRLVLTLGALAELEAAFGADDLAALAERFGSGIGVLRLSPDAFWRMTPRELGAAIEAVHGVVPEPIDAAAFATLRARFPDAN